MHPVMRPRFILLFLALFSLVSCTNSSNMQAYFATYTQQYFDLMKKARKHYLDHDTVGALALYKEAAELIPTQKEPWYRIAYINYTEQHYGEAIIGARETLKRDPSNTNAKNILAVSSFRVAAEALDYIQRDLRQGDVVYDEGKQLAKEMRAKMGDDLFGRERKISRPQPAAPVTEQNNPNIIGNPFNTL